MNSYQRVPRASGDEPGVALDSAVKVNEFPAQAGMNRLGNKAACRNSGVPRASGDEPRCPDIRESLGVSSPRKRG